MENISRFNSAIYRNSQGIINCRLKDLDIKSGQQDFFYVISLQEGISQKELSEFLYVGKSTTAKAVKSLIEKGYIAKEQDKNDRRISRLYLTQRGREISPKIKSTFLELVDILTRDLSEDEKEQTLNILKRILNRLYEEKNKMNSDNE